MTSISPLTKSPHIQISSSTNHLSQLQNRIPSVSDKAYCSHLLMFLIYINDFNDYQEIILFGVLRAQK